MDFIAMLVISVPVVFPIIIMLGIDPEWFGILTVLTVELGLVTPPVGMNVFVIKGDGAPWGAGRDLPRRDAFHRRRPAAPGAADRLSGAIAMDAVREKIDDQLINHQRNRVSSTGRHSWAGSCPVVTQRGTRLRQINV
ncbi:hypothetical protein BZY95_03445 [Billgrantia desiderata SP1]|nr:hypothetical protein BZY95_03445 [Halomonas desiderata SP1]